MFIKLSGLNMSVLANLLLQWEFYLAIFVIFLVTRLIKWLNDPLQKMPGPAGYPIIGNTFDYSLDKDMHKILLERAKKYGKIYKDYSVFTSTSVCVTDPAYAKQVAVTNSTFYHRNTAYLLKPLPELGTGLLTINGQAHAQQRKILNPGFSLGSVKHFISVFNDKGNELLKYYDDKINQSKGKPIEVEMLTKFTDMTLDVIGICAFGYNFNCVLGGNSKESEAINTILQANFNIVRRSFEDLFPFLKLIPSKERERVDEAKDTVHRIVNKVIELRREEMTTHPGETLEKNDLLQKLITTHEEAEVTFSNKDLFHQVFTFMLAGHETTSLTFTWTIYLLAKYPEFQARVRKEVQDVLQNGSDVSFEEIDKLKFLDDCIKESMRLYPAVIIHGRESVKEDRIGPYTIPPKTLIRINIGALGRNPDYWENPDDFDPDRFSKNVEKDPLFPYYYMPFSRGPRMCIGYRFAQLELKVVLAQLLKSFSFKLAPGQPEDIKGKLTLTYRPDPPPIIQISKV